VVDSLISFISDVKSRDSVLTQDSLETHFGCRGLGLVAWCLGLGFGLDRRRYLEHQLRQFHVHCILYFSYPTAKCLLVMNNNAELCYS